MPSVSLWMWRQRWDRVWRFDQAPALSAVGMDRREKSVWIEIAVALEVGHFLAVCMLGTGLVMTLLEN